VLIYSTIVLIFQTLYVLHVGPQLWYILCICMLIIFFIVLTVLSMCLLNIRLICINCVFGILCTLLCWLVALSWCEMCYANGLLKIFWLCMMSVLQIHLENISVPSGVVLKTNFYCNMRMLKLLNTYFILVCFYIFCLIVFICVYVTLPVFSCVMSVLLPCGEIKFRPTINHLLTFFFRGFPLNFPFSFVHSKVNSVHFRAFWVPVGLNS